MQKRFIEVVATSILIIILLFFTANTFRRIKKIKPVTPKNIESREAIFKDEDLLGKARARYNQIYKKLEDEAKNLKIKRDPFVFISIAPGQEISFSDLVITGIIWDEQNPAAIINDTIVKVGDNIGRNKIVGIEKDCVIINDGIKDIRLILE